MTDRERESYRDAIREDIRMEILNSTSRRNRYAEQIAQIHEAEENKKSNRRKSKATEEKVEKRPKDIKEARAKRKADKREADQITLELENKSFWHKYLAFCMILVAVSGVFLSYVWRSIRLYEKMQPEKVVEQEIQDLANGKGMEEIIFPDLEENEFSTVEEMKDCYLDCLRNQKLSYRLQKEDYQTGKREYILYAENEAVGQLDLQVMKSEKRLGILPISQMEVECIRPVMNIMVWDYEFEVLDSYHIFVNDMEVGEKYKSGNATDIPQFAYLYEYGNMPRLQKYYVDGIYKEAKIEIKDEAGKEISYEMENNKIKAGIETLAAEAGIPAEIASEIDVLEAAKTWNLFTTRDLTGAHYGLDQVRKYFIKDSYYWQKLGEYANGIDITLVSDHNPASTTFSNETVSKYQRISDSCFSCEIAFEKHMQLKIGREQLDQTDSIFYFLKIDDTDDGEDNPSWKIADIQAVVNQM